MTLPLPDLPREQPSILTSRPDITAIIAAQIAANESSAHATGTLIDHPGDEEATALKAKCDNISRQASLYLVVQGIKEYGPEVQSVSRAADQQLHLNGIEPENASHEQRMTALRHIMESAKTALSTALNPPPKQIDITNIYQQASRIFSTHLSK